MIKLDGHRLVCGCEHCRAMFPHDRFDAMWLASEPEGSCRPALAQIPLGPGPAAIAVKVFLDADADRLATDFPGMPGTAGARVTVQPSPDGNLRIVGTVDPILRALTPEVPLLRRAAERLTSRCLVSLGVIEPESADFLRCAEHGHGLAALTCEHLLDSQARDHDFVLIYSVEADYPDALCSACCEQYLAGDVSVTRPICSRCLQGRIYANKLVATSCYGG